MRIRRLKALRCVSVCLYYSGSVQSGRLWCLPSKVASGRRRDTDTVGVYLVSQFQFQLNEVKNSPLPCVQFGRSIGNTLVDLVTKIDGQVRGRVYQVALLTGRGKGFWGKILRGGEDSAS